MPTKITIELTITGPDADEALEAVNSMLDEGIVQDEIAEYAVDTGRKFVITSAMASAGFPAPRWRCLGCEAFNASNRSECRACGAARPEPMPAPATTAASTKETP